jgi:hypothetical protein
MFHSLARAGLAGVGPEQVNDIHAIHQPIAIRRFAALKGERYFMYPSSPISLRVERYPLAYCHALRCRLRCASLP